MCKYGDTKTFSLVHFQLTTDGFPKLTNIHEFAIFSTNLEKYIYAK